MLKEKASLHSIPNQSVLELFQSQSLRWQLLTIIIAFISLQLSGINAVSVSFTSEALQSMISIIFTHKLSTK